MTKKIRACVCERGSRGSSTFSGATPRISLSNVSHAATINSASYQVGMSSQVLWWYFMNFWLTDLLIRVSPRDQWAESPYLINPLSAEMSRHLPLLLKVKTLTEPDGFRFLLELSGFISLWNFQDFSLILPGTAFPLSFSLVQRLSNQPNVKLGPSSSENSPRLPQIYMQPHRNTWPMILWPNWRQKLHLCYVLSINFDKRMSG